MKPLRRDARENRQRVLDAAQVVFAAHGLDAPVDAVAVAAGVGIGTLYRHFPTKAALIEQLVADLYESQLVAGRQALLEEDGNGLETFLRHAIGSQQSWGECISRLWEIPKPEALLEEFDALIDQLLDQAKRKGAIRKDCTTTDVGITLWAARGVIEMSGQSSVAQERLLDIILAGLRPHAALLIHRPLTAQERIAIFRARTDRLEQRQARTGDSEPNPTRPELAG
jgi:AcrR family transcriptional regulator